VRFISRKLGISPRTVYRYKDLEEPPPRQTYSTRASVLDPYVPYLLGPAGALERRLSQRQAAPAGDPRERLLKQRADVHPLHERAAARGGGRQTAVFRTEGQEGLRGGAISHGQERRRPVHA
jgi:hypothetical protein